MSFADGMHVETVVAKVETPFLRGGRKFSKTHLGLICLITQNLLGRDNFSSLVSLAINFSGEGSAAVVLWWLSLCTTKKAI